MDLLSKVAVTTIVMVLTFSLLLVLMAGSSEARMPQVETPASVVVARPKSRVLRKIQLERIV